MGSTGFRETTNQSWFARLGKSFQGILLGFFIVTGAILLLFWNEGRAVKTAKSLQEGRNTVITISERIINTQNEGKLVHLTGLATTKEVLNDGEFGVSENAIKLLRQVEMYQWNEKKESHTRKKLGGETETTTQYNYYKDWSESHIKSTHFKDPQGHNNPESMIYKSNEFIAEKVSVGKFLLSYDLLRQMKNYKNLVVAENNKQQAFANLMDKLKVLDGIYYIGADTQNPQIGDFRISYKVVKPSTVSIVAKQHNDSFQPYITSYGEKIHMLNCGSYTADEMFTRAESQNKFFTWILRIVGFIAIMIGFSMIMAPIAVLADIIPFLGNLVAAGTGLIALCFSLALSLIIIALGWLFYRPLIGLLLIIVAAVPVIWIFYKQKK